MTTMKSVRIHRFGGAEVLALDDVSVPEPRPDEIIVKVLAASVNPVDFKTREGHFPPVSAAQLPYTLGRDLSGIVERAGFSTSDFQPGDAVYAMLGNDRGSQAQYVAVKRVEAAAKPASLDHVQAAAVPLAGLTAWQGLFDHGGLAAGQRVLIQGGAGGVGHLAIQLAKAAGAVVATTVAREDLDFARRLGADQVIDYRTQRFEEELQLVDVVFDLVGGDTQGRSWPVLKPGGILVSTLMEPSQGMALKLGVRGLRYMALPNGRQLAKIGELIEQGKVKPHVAATYRLTEVAAAERRLEQKHLRGKLVLDIAA